MPKKRVQVDAILKGKFSEGGLDYGAGRYLNSGEMDKTNALRLAIAIVFGPAGYAQEGAGMAEVEQHISVCRRMVEGYWQAALASAQIEANRLPYAPSPPAPLIRAEGNNDSEPIDLMEEL